MCKGEAPLTAEQLQLGLRQLWRPGWPRDLKDVLADPVRGQLVRAMARCLSRKQPTAGNTPPARRAPVPPTPTAPPIRKQGAQRPVLTFDAKRAAANDYDE